MGALQTSRKNSAISRTGRSVPLQRGLKHSMFDPTIHHRRSLRWRKHNYTSPGLYYVTICIQDHRCLLGNVESGVMRLSGAGRMVDGAWLNIPHQFPTMQLDEYVVMPNHFHGIVQIREESRVAEVGATREVAVTAREQNSKTLRAGSGHFSLLGNLIGAFKSLTTDEYIRGVHRLGWGKFQGHFWQRNYYDHVVRDHNELEKIREYISQNPLIWTCDRYNPENSVLVLDDSSRLVPWTES